MRKGYVYIIYVILIHFHRKVIEWFWIFILVHKKGRSDLFISEKYRDGVEDFVRNNRLFERV